MSSTVDNEKEKSCLKTHVKGLDELLRNGFVLPKSKEKGFVILIKGFPGTGKTTLSLQIAAGALQWNLIKTSVATEIVVYNHEQACKDIKNILRRMDCRKNKNLSICGSEKNNVDQPDKPLDSLSWPLQWANTIADELEEKTVQCRMIVVDGLNLMSIKERTIFQIERLVDVLRRRSLVSVLIYETDEKTHDSLNYLADMIIQLKGEESQENPRYYLNHIQIVKARFQSHALGWHQYKIRNDGIVVYPSIHFRVHRFNLLDGRLDDSQKSIIAWEKGKKEDPPPIIINDGSAIQYLLRKSALQKGEGVLQKGSCTIVLGARRTWKTLLTLDFLRAGSQKGKKGILVSVMDNQSTIVSQRKKLCDSYVSS